MFGLSSRRWWNCDVCLFPAQVVWFLRSTGEVNVCGRLTANARRSTSSERLFKEETGVWNSLQSIPPSLPPSYLALLQLVAPQVTSELVCAFRIDLFVRALKKLGDAGGLLISWERSCNSKLSVLPRSNVQHLTSEHKRLLTEMCFCTRFGPVDQGGEHQAAEWRYENTFIFCPFFSFF